MMRKAMFSLCLIKDLETNMSYISCFHVELMYIIEKLVTILRY